MPAALPRQVVSAAPNRPEARWRASRGPPPGLPGGGYLSIEFINEAPDADAPRLGAWLELRAEDPEALLRAALDAGLTQVQHPGHPYCFMAPGGQVFTIAPQT
jgi:hypothetical protein